jgi:IS5 family transposase
MPCDTLVSVIVPAYNVGPFIANCLDALLNRQFATIEVIVVDDGSTDSTPQVLAGYQQRFSNLTVLRHEHNLGVSTARNHAIEAASGDYFLFVDADDLLHDKAIPFLLNEIETCAADILMFQFRSVNDNNAVIHKTCEIPVVYDLNDGIMCRKAFYHLGAFLPWNGFFSRKVIKDIRFKPYSHGEDSLFAFEAFLAAATFRVVPDVLYDYNQHPDSASQLITLDHLRSQMGIASEMLQVARRSTRFIYICSPLYRKIWGIMTGYVLQRVNKISENQRRFFWNEWFDHLDSLFLEDNNEFTRHKKLCQLLCRARSPTLAICLVEPTLLAQRMFMRIPVMAGIWHRFRKSAVGA